ncbi:MAG: nucleoside recognition protein [Synergistaceae bacterium]|nr:nucleoside recognition protein [Synergistaceae bacterium]
MMNYIWVGLVAIAILAGVATGNIEGVQTALFGFAETAVDIVIGLVGVMVFWMGLMKVAEKAGVTEKIGLAIKPVMTKLFPDVPADHPAMSSMVMNLAANVIGLGNAATPFGLKAMKDLQSLNKTKDMATDAMVMFLAINTTSVTLIPTSVIALRASAGSKNPTEVLGAIIVATVISTATGIAAAILFGKTKTWNLQSMIDREREAGTLRLNEDYEEWKGAPAKKTVSVGPGPGR